MLNECGPGEVDRGSGPQDFPWRHWIAEITAVDRSHMEQREMVVCVEGWSMKLVDYLSAVNTCSFVLQHHRN